MEALIVLDKNITLSNYDLKGKFVIGVEKGALLLLQHGITDFIALGDFDSVLPNQFLEIEKRAKKVIKLNSVKDDTDTFDAYKLSSDCSKITILGGIQGKRIEHFIANINLIKQDKRVELIDDNSHIYSLDSLDSTKYEFDNSKYKFVSFFAIDEAILSLINFKYELTDYLLKADDSLCISNEIDSKYQKAYLEIKKGRVLVVQSKKD